jgi:ABC-type lipoprotein release transport system permease subunit
LNIKLLFRKKSAVAAVLALALLVAIVASMNAIVNFVNFQSSAVGQLASVGDKYLVVSKNCTSLMSSHVGRETVNALNCSEINSFSGQRVFNCGVQTSSGNYTTILFAVENLTGYLQVQSAYLNGSVPKSSGEADIGMLFAETSSLDKDDYAVVTVGNDSLTVKIVGVTRTQSQLDSEIIVPIQTTDCLTVNGDFSFVEFRLKAGVDKQETINRIAALLPNDVEVVKVQQTTLFLKQSTDETLNFLAVWSITVYVLVSTASYVISTRLIVESDPDLAILKAIGAKRRDIFTMVFTYTAATAVAGSVLGISLGVVGTQIASTVLRFVWHNAAVTPYLELNQIGQILLLSFVFSMLGCIYPALKSTQRNYE